MDAGDFYNPLKEVFQYVQVKHNHIDTNIVFLLHRKVTVFLLAFILACFNLYFIGLGDYAIDCYSPSSAWVTHEMFRVSCWTTGTFIVVEKLNGRIGIDVPHPGIGQIFASKTDTVHYQLSYGFLYPYFLIVIILFRCPWWIWKRNLERGLLRCLLKEIQTGFIKIEGWTERKKLIVNYFVMNLDFHDLYAYKYIMCELLNLFHVFFEMWLADFMLQGQFTSYGLDVLNVMRMDPYDRIDPMAMVFPKVTHCIMNTVGPSGNVQPLSGICIMPLNNILEHMFVGMWFWYAVLVVCSCLGLVYRLLTIYVPPLRYLLLRIHTRADPEKLQLICKRCRYGDWYLLFCLSNLLEVVLIDEILEDFADKLVLLEG